MQLLETHAARRATGKAKIWRIGGYSQGGETMTYVYVLRTDQTVIGVFEEKKAALAKGEDFTMTHSRIFLSNEPQPNIPRAALFGKST